MFAALLEHNDMAQLGRITVPTLLIWGDADGEEASALGIHGAEDEPPRSKTVCAPALGRHETLVGASAHAVGKPLGQLVVVRRRPSAVELEPLVRVHDGLGCVHAHECC